MRAFLVVLSVVAAFAAVVVLGRAAPAPPVETVLAEEAGGEDRPVVLEFSAAWCNACTTFQRHVLPDPRVEQALDGVRYVRYDIERGAGKVEAARYGVTSLPTILVIDREGAPVGAVRGLPSVTSFLELLASTDRASR
jgi:thiol:disulfide interchange protein